VASRWAYFDTSVLVKRYLNEPGSILARTLFRNYRFVSCALVALEAFSTFSRLKAGGELSERNFSAILARVGTDRRQWEFVDLHRPILTLAEEVVERTQVRALGALYVASALALQERSRQALPFVTADERQRQAAQQMRLQVIWVAAP
jgi:predicted nucleic acid-binding protein